MYSQFMMHGQKNMVTFLVLHQYGLIHFNLMYSGFLTF